MRLTGGLAHPFPAVIAGSVLTRETECTAARSKRAAIGINTKHISIGVKTAYPITSRRRLCRNLPVTGKENRNVAQIASDTLTF
jgi:hypothetical protein